MCTAVCGLRLGTGHLTMLTNLFCMLCSGGLIQGKGKSKLCGSQDQAQLLGLLLFEVLSALSEPLPTAREWPRQHLLPKEQ